MKALLRMVEEKAVIHDEGKHKHGVKLICSVLYCSQDTLWYQKCVITVVYMLSAVFFNTPPYQDKCMYQPTTDTSFKSIRVGCFF